MKENKHYALTKPKRKRNAIYLRKRLSFSFFIHLEFQGYFLCSRNGILFNFFRPVRKLIVPFDK